MECPRNGHMYSGFHEWGEKNAGFPDTFCIGGAFSRQRIEGHVQSEERKKSKQQQLRVLEVVVAVFLCCWRNLTALKISGVGRETGEEMLFVL